MEIRNFFPTPVYIHQANNEEMSTRLNNLQSDLEQRDTLFNSESYQNGYTSYFTNCNLQSLEETRDLCLYIIHNCRIYMKELGYEDDIGIGITSLWVSRQSKGAEHHLHNHRMSFISGTYYSQAEEDSARLMFQSPLEHLKMNWPVSDVDSILNRDDEFIAPRTNTILLFPSFLNHKVEKHLSQSDRIAWSFNINLIRY
jgi:uncharacterized protein (TIGR02466 family)